MTNREEPPHLHENILEKAETRAVAAARKLVERLTLENRMLALAESCTGGLISEIITRVSGASAVLWGSFVCYSPAAKKRMLCIDSGLLAGFGLVSRETAREMALKALEISGVVLSASVTGLAGPGLHVPAELKIPSETMPPGTVWTAIAMRDGSSTIQVTEKEYFFLGTRAEVKMQAAAVILEKLLVMVDTNLKNTVLTKK